MKKLLSIAFALALGYGANAQSYTPVTLTGFNADVVADGSGTVISSTTHDVDGVNYNFVAQNFVNPASASPTSALPTSGTINSVVASTPGLTYQLAPYTGNNSLRISGTGSGTLTFATPVMADQVFVLATSGSGASTSTITVTFSDGATEVFTQTVSDWFNASEFAIQGISRVNRTNDNIENSTTNPRLYQYLLPLSIANITRTIQSITFNKTTAGGVLNVMGISVSTAPAPAANDAGIAAVLTPVSPVQAGVSQPVLVTLVNQGTTNLTSATLTWTVDGVAQPNFAWTGNLAMNQSATVTLGNFTFAAGAPVVNVCATNPNGATDGFAANDCAQVTLNACNVLAGVYTIDNTATASATNFTTLGAAITAMSSCGVSGPVTFNVVAGTGPYTEQLDIPAIAGASATNTITFNGNGNTISADPVTANRAVIKLNGADFVTIDNFVITTTGTATSSFGWGIHFINGADNNTISNNTINIGSLSTTESNSGGIVFSNSTSSAITTGNNGSNNVISGNTINGGYNGIVLYGTATSTGNNQITGNIIRNFYATGVKLGSANGTLVENNNISRPNRTPVGTFEGVTMNGTTQGSIISKNRIHNSHGGAATLSGTVYGVFSNANDAPAGAENLVKNNLVYGINNTGTIYGFYNSGSDGVYYYHNTINLDHPANTGTNRGFFQTTAANNIQFRNNIVNITAGTSGAKHALYFGTTTSAIDSDRNNLFVSGGASSSGIGFFSSNRVSLADWQTASGDDANSVSADPLFAGIASSNFTPTNVILNNIGAPVVPAVTDDITGATRSTTTPDPGAYEFTVASVDLGAVALALPAVKSCYSNAEQVTITIQNWGSSPLDFTTTNATVTVNVTGAVTQTLTITLNDNSLNGGQPLAAAAMLDVPVGTLDMTTMGTYTFDAATAITTGGTDGNPANNAMTAESITVVPVAAGTAAATITDICQSGSTALSLTGNAGGDIQWQEAASATGPFTDITGATSAAFTPAAPLTATTYYRAMVSCGANSANSNVITVTVNNPQAPVATGDARCGSGTVALTATPSAGATINWYDAATGGTPVATGNTYSPNVTATTTYYAASSIGGSTESVGHVNGGTSSFITATTGWGLHFNATVPVTINTVHVYPTGTGTITVKITNTSDVVLFTGPTVNITGTGTQKVPVPVNLAIPAGTYKMVMSYTGITNLVRESGGTSFPYTSPSGAVNITAGANGAGTATAATSYYWFYDWSISTGCESARTPVVATVNPAPVVNLGADILHCNANPVVLDAGNAGATYQWSLNGTVIPNATFQTLSVVTGGTYSVSVTNGGCTSSDDVVVTIGVAPAAPTVTAAGATTFCAGNSVALTGATTTAGATYRWSRNGAPIAGATSATYSATQGGNYRVIATVGSCSDSSAVTAVTVNPLPATPVITQNGAVLNSNAATGNQWYLNGTLITGATNASFTPTVSGAYTVIATANGCSSPASNSVNITITGLGSGQPELQVSVYPNPSDGLFNVLLPAGKTYELRVTDLAGKLINQQTIENTNVQLQLQTVAKGIYILQIISEGKTFARKLVIE